MTQRPNVTLTDGSAVTPDHAEIDPRTGLQKAYVVLSADERAKGFVRPVRLSYRHVGARGPIHATRPLTAVEQALHARWNYVLYEDYPSDAAAIVIGRFWTQAQLDRVDAGCGSVTTMARAIAESYARDPNFYGATMCVTCRAHFPVGAAGEFVWDGTDERVGT